MRSGHDTCRGCSAVRPAKRSRCAGEHHGNHGALALAAGKLGQVAVGEVLQVELGDASSTMVLSVQTACLDGRDSGRT